MPPFLFEFLSAGKSQLCDWLVGCFFGIFFLKMASRMSRTNKSKNYSSSVLPPDNYLSSELGVLSNCLKIGREDDWVRSIQSENVDETRTLTFEFHRPFTDFEDVDLNSQYNHILMPTVIISVYFPKSPNDKPFCFCENDSESDHQFVSKVTEHANEV